MIRVREARVKANISQSGMRIAVPVLDELGAIQYAFTTRQNGRGSRTNGFKQPDDWKPVADEFGIHSDRLITVNQVHGDAVVLVDDSNYRGFRSTEADAIITRERGLAIGVETADCVPVLLVDPAAPAAAAVHAGWRSTVRNIVGKAVAKLRHEFGSEPSCMIAVIGPAIGPECYEVDEPVMGPVREAFDFWEEAAAPRAKDRWSLDLVKLNRMALVRAGLSDRNIHSVGLCTSCNPGLFYSFRREGRTGRMLSVVMIR